jgi:molecular chaperone Hsp33
VVALEGQGLEEAAHQYFRQSEQIPTRVRLAVAEQFEGGRRTYRAGGLLIQFLPTSPERMRQGDLAPGDIPEGHPSNDLMPPAEDDAWVEAKALVETVEDIELIDPAVSSERLLYRLFHERGVRVFDAQSIHEECRCSTDRIMNMMRRFSPEDRRDMVGDNGRIGITCEFCSRFYELDPKDVEAQIAQAETP